MNYTQERTYNLFLDDKRDIEKAFTMTLDPDYRTRKWYVVRSFQEFCDFVDHSFQKYRSIPILISFDHDLADEHYLHQEEPIQYERFTEKTGYDCAKWLLNFCTQHHITIPDYKIHSMNFVGEQNIINEFEKFTHSSPE